MNQSSLPTYIYTKSKFCIKQNTKLPHNNPFIVEEVMAADRASSVYLFSLDNRLEWLQQYELAPGILKVQR